MVCVCLVAVVVVVEFWGLVARCVLKVENFRVRVVDTVVEEWRVGWLVGWSVTRVPGDEGPG